MSRKAAASGQGRKKISIGFMRNVFEVIPSNYVPHPEGGLTKPVKRSSA
jgi:hypothetical protein